MSISRHSTASPCRLNSERPTRAQRLRSLSGRTLIDLARELAGTRLARLEMDPVPAGDMSTTAKQISQAASPRTGLQGLPSGDGESLNGQGANPRKRPPSPINVSRQDAQRPFAFGSSRRNSTGLNNLSGYTGSPTSDVRMLPAIPAESATRSTFDTALPPIRVVLSPSTASHGIMTESPVTSLAPMTFQTSSAEGGQPGSNAVESNRPKGRGTLELERVLDMWAAKTPTTAAFPGSIGLPSAASNTTSGAASTSQPFLTHSVVTAEPDALDLALSSVRAGTTSTSTSVFADFAQLAATQQPGTAASSSRNSLGVREGLPRRQRSRSEADLMRLDTMSLGGISLGDFLNGLSTSNAPNSQFSIDLTQPVSAIPTYGGGQRDESGQATTSQGLRLLPPSAPISFAVKTVQSPAVAGQQPFDFSRNLELKISHAPSQVDGEQQPGGLRARRARSQEPGHRYSKSDDLSHLFSTLSSTGSVAKPSPAPSHPQQAQPYLTSANGHLAPPSFDQAQQFGAHSTAPLAPALQLIAQQVTPAAASGQQDAQSSSSRPEFIHLPNGMTLPIAYFAPLPPPPPPSQSQPTSSAPPPPPQASTSAVPAQSDLPVQPRLLPEFSPQGNALALAAAQAAQAHAAQVAQAAAVATMQFSNATASTSSAVTTSDANLHPSFLPNPPGPYNINAVGPGGPYSYHSPTGQSLVLPTPPPMPMPGANSSGKPKRAPRTTARAASGGGGSGSNNYFEADLDEMDSSGEDDDDDDADEYYEDSPKHKKAKFAPKPSSSSRASGKKAAAPKKRPAQAKASIAVGPKGNADGSPGHDDEDEYSRESKTTRATIDAAQRRRNANAVAKFVCELCGETFTRRYNLRGHQRAHKGEKPYQCSYDGCDKVREDRCSFSRPH